MDRARLNGPMVARLRRCAADTSSNWDGAITIYPPEARELVALIDDTEVKEPEPPCCGDAEESVRSGQTVLHTGGCVHRCDIPVTIAMPRRIGTYPCALTVGHPADVQHWIPEGYVRATDG